MSVAQAALAATVLASTVGTYVALSPPHANKRPPSSTSTSSTPAPGDAIHELHLASQSTTNAVMAPLGLLSLHTAGLALFWPASPANSELVTWSVATAVPLALILGVGVPLRLCSYATLGRNFTFALAQPDRLTTMGIYRHVQHPGYVGVQVLLAGNAALLCRTDGALGCWIPAAWHHIASTLAWTLSAAAVVALALAARLRIRQEEQMLRTRFGVEWERWHGATARFVPYLF